MKLIVKATVPAVAGAFDEYTIADLLQQDRKLQAHNDKCSTLQLPALSLVKFDACSCKSGAFAA
jgi:hypothetical protein